MGMEQSRESKQDPSTRKQPPPKDGPDPTSQPSESQQIVPEDKSLYEQDPDGYYLDGRKKKYWVHNKKNCFMLFPRGMSITWSNDTNYWTWNPLGEGSDVEKKIEVAELKNVCWLEIHGKLSLSHLTAGVTYEVVFEVKLKNRAYGLSVPVNLQLKLPDGTVTQQKENLKEKPREQWLQLKVGEFKRQKDQEGEVQISMFEYGGQWKKGLVIKGIRITPRE